ncbi:MAG TPA: Ig-like domain-containing protein [Polyangiales bacterium]|nr:Ig-like domain-containing protein [Polyangiales bacterium]
MRLLRCVALVALAWLAMAPREAAAQPCPTDKFCFYVPPGLPFDGSHSTSGSRNFDIVLSSPVNTVTGTYAVSGGAPQAFTVAPGVSTRVALGNGGAATSYGTPSNVGVFLVSDAPDLTVDHRETFDQEQYSETIKRDTIALGTRFRLGSYSLNREGRPNAGVDAALVYAPTGATVTLTAPTGAALPYWLGSATDTLSATLAPGQTIALRTLVGVDMDGALLTSTQPVAVSAGGRGWSTPGSCGDDGMDGLVPTSSFGTQFVARLPTGTALGGNESRVRVIADVDNTEVRINGVLAATLAAGSFHNFQPTALAYVQTSQPAMVWMNGSLNGCELDTVLIPPIAFAPALTALSLDFNVIASTQNPAAEMALLISGGEVSSIRLNGVAPTFLSNEVVPGRPDLAYVRFVVAQGDRNVRATSDFQALLASRTSPSGLLAYYNPYRIPGCGDSGIDPGEQCDDADADDGDGCSSTCQIEPGFVCSGMPSVCVSACGNNTLNAGETCDDGNRTAGDGCNATCRRELTISAPASGAILTSTPAITGSADPGASVMIMVDGATGTVTADGSGSWTFTPASPLADGAKTVTAIATDTASGVSMTTRSFTIDSGTTVAITGPTGTIGQATPGITGTGEPGANIAISIDGMDVGTTAVGTDGSWSLPLTTPLAQGPHTIGAIATDANGNTATATPVTFTVDSGTSVSITQPTAGSATDRMPIIRGGGEPGITVQISIDGQPVGQVTSGTDGSWTLPLTTPLAEGPHTVTAVGTDAQGNRAQTSIDFAVREAVLIIHNVPDGAFTRDPRPPFNGVSSPGAHVLVSLDGVLLDTVISSYRGFWELILIDTLTPGVHVLEASTTDRGGRTLSDRHTFTYALETTPLALTTPAPGSVTADATPTVTGSSSPNTRVRISIDGRPIGEATAGPDGSFSFDVPTPLADGRHVVRLDAGDSARNPSAVEGPFFVDTKSRVEILAPADGARVGNARPFITGTAEPLTRLTVAIDGVDIGELDVPLDGRWVLQVPTALSPGDHRVRARAVDQLGNRAEDEQGFRYDPSLNDDRDGDGRPDSEECASSPCPDSDGDGTADIDDPDDDGDGIPTAQECASTPCPDSDGDGTADWRDPDDDNDGRPTRDELGMDGKPRDTDSDGVPDHLDPDDDGDSIPTRTECAAAPCPDTDSDGTADYLDPDDDNDRVPTAREKADSDRLNNDDADGDGRKNWQDPDANGNGADDGTDGVGDDDGDGTPDYLDTDTERPTPPNTESALDYSVAGGGGCALGRGADASWLWALALLLRRRRRQA